MNDEYAKNVEEFLDSSIKISYEFPKFCIEHEKPDMSFDVEIKKNKKKLVIERKDDRRKPKSGAKSNELF